MKSHSFSISILSIIRSRLLAIHFKYMSRSKTIYILILIILLSAFLRIFGLGNIPPSLYSDEASQGYNAYSLLFTGKDEYGTFLPVSLRSFGDWKPPLPAYLMIPSIWLWGLSEYSIRFPSAILGIATVILIFFTTLELLREQKNRVQVALLSSFYLAISPWHILQSRAAMLVAVGLFCLLGGVYLFLKGLKNKRFFFLSSILFALAVYSYYGLRVVTPLILLLLLIKFRKKILLFRRELFFSGVLGFLLLLPLFSAFLKQPDVVFGRAKTVSIFYDQGINLRKWELITQDGTSAIPLITRFFHNNVYMYARSIVQRFLSHLDSRYLFFNGDGSQPFQIPNMGILYIPDLAFILTGLLVLFRNKYFSRWFILFWIIISLIPASLTFVTPSSNRTFNAVIAYAILSAIGIVYIKKSRFPKILTAVTITVFYSLSFGYFLNQYFVKLPLNFANFWNYGWREVVGYVKNNDAGYSNIIVPDINGMPYIYFLLYQKYPPVAFQTTAVRPFVADRFGFEHVEAFDKYLFPAEFDWNFTKKYNLQKNSLYVIPAAYAQEDSDYVKAIYYPNGKIAFKIFAYK